MLKLVLDREIASMVEAGRNDEKNISGLEQPSAVANSLKPGNEEDDDCR
jgi:hypothetical protein